MKIAVISDIHGNLEALNAVLQDIETQEIDKIFICGDLAMGGPEPEKTVDKIIELLKQKKAAIILGNTDEMIIKAFGKQEKEYTPADETMAASLKYTQQILRPDQIEFLKQLPLKHKEKIGKLEILFVHGSPRKINENISPDLDEKILREILSGTQEDIIFCGHTHLPVIYKINNQTIVNVGSVGRPFTENPEACYAILAYPASDRMSSKPAGGQSPTFGFSTPASYSKDFNISHKFVKYDKETTAKKLQKLPFSGSEKLAQVILHPLDRHDLFK